MQNTASIKMKIYTFLLVYTNIFTFNLSSTLAKGPVVVNTWNYSVANEKAWEVLNTPNKSAKDAIEEGISACEEVQCGLAVGYGGTPDETGETTLDAMIFDGTNMDMGAVGGLRRIKEAISTARYVLEKTKHSFLVGDMATDFAKQFGFNETSLSTNESLKMWEDWKRTNCQPNFWRNVSPNPQESCGPYSLSNLNVAGLCKLDENNHDTIGMAAIDAQGNVASGTSTNGLIHKIHGRVGDSPIAGAGSYADSEVGAACATGDGDIMMRFLPSFLAVEEMRKGATPDKAAQTAISRIKSKYPDFFGAVIALHKDGSYAAACNGMSSFPFIVADKNVTKSTYKTVTCS